MFRMDVEGAEWEMIDQLLEMLPRIRTLSAEFHFPMGVRNIEKMFALLCLGKRGPGISGGGGGGGEGGDAAGAGDPEGNVPGCFNVATWRYAWCPDESHPCLEITAGRVEDAHSSPKAGTHG
eukprot:g12828.t1